MTAHDWTNQNPLCDKLLASPRKMEKRPTLYKRDKTAHKSKIKEANLHLGASHLIGNREECCASHCEAASLKLSCIADSAATKETVKAPTRYTKEKRTFTLDKKNTWTLHHCFQITCQRFAKGSVDRSNQLKSRSAGVGTSIK